MSVKVSVHIEVDHGVRGRTTLELAAPTQPGDNPVYVASQVRKALLNAAGRADKALVAEFGDIADRADGWPLPGDYTWPLVAGTESSAPRAADAPGGGW